jgi:threonine synthase
MADMWPPGGLDHVVVQVGGGALATAVGDGLRGAGVHARIWAAQTEGCAPFERAWRRTGGRDAEEAARRWHECMWPWESTPLSVATGILDDETYDWVGVIEALSHSGGAPIVVPESLVVSAAELARRVTGRPVDATGAAGLAGLLALQARDGAISDAERAVVLFTGRDRTAR